MSYTGKSGLRKQKTCPSHTARKWPVSSAPGGHSPAWPQVLFLCTAISEEQQPAYTSRVCTVLLCHLWEDWRSVYSTLANICIPGKAIPIPSFKPDQISSHTPQVSVLTGQRAKPGTVLSFAGRMGRPQKDTAAEETTLAKPSENGNECFPRTKALGT